MAANPLPDLLPEGAETAAPLPIRDPILKRAAETSATERPPRPAPLASLDPSIPLLLAADFLEDIERTRIVTENRLRALIREPGVEGDSSKGLPAELPSAQRHLAHVDALRSIENAATLELKRALREHPLGEWVKRTVGVGEKQGARLIASIGDPYVNDAEGRPRRGPAELWAYCGLHTVASGDHQGRDSLPAAVSGGNVAARRRKGVKANWNARAKMRAYLVAESCMKQRTSPYRAVYDRERAKWVTRDATDGHAHAHALRVMAKEILKDLWVESRDLHHSGEWPDPST